MRKPIKQIGKTGLRKVFVLLILIGCVFASVILVAGGYENYLDLYPLNDTLSGLFTITLCLFGVLSLISTWGIYFNKKWAKKTSFIVFLFYSAVAFQTVHNERFPWVSCEPLVFLTVAGIVGMILILILDISLTPRRIFKSLVFLTGGILIIHAIFNGLFSIRLHKVLNRLESEGVPLKPSFYSPQGDHVFDTENAALLYRSAISLNNAYETRLDELLKRLEDFYPCYIDGIQKWIKENKIELTREINSEEGRNYYDLIKKGSLKPHCRFAIDYFPLYYPYDDYRLLGKTKKMFTFLSLQALLEAEEGDLKQAFNTVATGLRISRHFGEDPLLLMQILSWQNRSILVQTLQIISAGKSIPEKETLDIIKLLDWDMQNGIFMETMKIKKIQEGIMYMDVIRTNRLTPPGVLRGYCHGSYYGSYYELADGMERFSSSRQWKRAIINCLWAPLWKRDLLYYFRRMSQVEKEFAMPYWEVLKLQKNISAKEEIHSFCSLCNYVWFWDISDFVNKLRPSRIDVCRTALAIKLFRAKHGAYPVSLEDIEGEILSDVPLDLFTGKPLIYKQSGEWFVLYSIGPNLADDSGVPEYNTKGEIGKNYDIAWDEKTLLEKIKDFNIEVPERVIGGIM